MTASFKIIGKINCVDNIITPFVREDLERFRPYCESEVCDICHTAHHRTSLFIVRFENGEEKTAGRGCLDKMYGKEAVKTAISLGEEEAVRIGEECYKTADMVNLAKVIVDCNGFISRNKAIELGTLPTSEFIKNVVGNRDYMDYIEASRLEENNVAEKVLNYFKTLDDAGNTFLVNCKEVANKEWVSSKALNLFPAMINSYRKAMADKAIRESYADSYFGEEGEKVKTPMMVTLLAKSSFAVENYYSYNGGVEVKNRYFLITENREILVWTTSTDTLENVKEGSELTLERFTVKTHKEHGKYGKITNILRPKFSF